MFCSRCGTEVDNQAKFCPSCGLDLATTTPLAAVQPEKTEDSEIDAVREALQDEWEIYRELGRGGMAIVFKARDRHLDRDVAIKVLPFSLAFDKEFVERFQREARTAAKLEHPHIIPIYRVGKSGRVIYFVMKFLRGGSLSEKLDQGGAIPPGDIRRLLAETSGALGYAHKHGIVHRDIKPDNIMFDEVGHSVVTDFGIAKAATGTRLTGTGMSIGTPHYMSPEQARAQKLDGRSDIYSLGVVAYQCLVGHVPFDGEDAFSIGYKHIMEELPTPPLPSGEHREVYQIIKRMMAKGPEDRFQSADDLVTALQGKVPITAPTPVTTSSDVPTTVMPSAETAAQAPPPGVRPSTPTTPIPRAEPLPAPKREKKRSGMLVGMLLILILGGGGAGGYWYFVMGAEWPPTFSRTEQPAVTPAESTLVDDTLQVAAGDSAAAAAADSVPAAAGDTADTAAAAAVTTPPVRELPNYGVIRLRGAPRFATVSVDGERVEGNMKTVDPGSRVVSARLTGYEDFRRTVVVKRGDTLTVTINMTPIVVDYCTDPGDSYNQDGSCYDVRPSATAAPIVPIPPQVQEPVQPVQLWVRVKADGTAERIQWIRTSEPRFTSAAGRFAMQMQYTPATKDGNPVDAWFKLTLQGRRQ